MFPLFRQAAQRSFGLFAPVCPPKRPLGRNGNWTVWLVAVAVSPGPSDPSPIGVAGTPLPVSPPSPEASAAVPLRPDGGGPGRFARGHARGMPVAACGDSLSSYTSYRPWIDGHQTGVGALPTAKPRLWPVRSTPRSEAQSCSPVPWRIAAVPPALGFP